MLRIAATGVVAVGYIDRWRYADPASNKFGKYKNALSIKGFIAPTGKKWTAAHCILKDAGRVLSAYIGTSYSRL